MAEPILAQVVKELMQMVWVEVDHEVLRFDLQLNGVLGPGLCLLKILQKFFQPGFEGKILVLAVIPAPQLQDIFDNGVNSL